MNMVLCGEDCCYQKDGYCKMKDSVPISAKPINGCCYYKQRKVKRKLK